jgi:Spy/CpxP family protein refolding chaperone
MTFHSHRMLLSAGALALVVGLAASPSLSAQNTSGGQPPFRGRGMMGPGGPGMPGGPGGPLELILGRGAERLGLTDAQQSQIKSIAEAHKNDLQALMKAAGDARRALVAAQINAQPDDQIRALAGQVGAAETEMAVAQAHVAAEVMQVLTPDQQAQVKQLVTQIGQRGPRGRGRR